MEGALRLVELLTTIHEQHLQAQAALRAGHLLRALAATDQAEAATTELAAMMLPAVERAMSEDQAA